MSLLDYHPRNPCRPPHCGYGLASDLDCEMIRPNRRRDDQWVRRARSFLRGLHRAGGDLDDPRLIRADRAVLGAYRLRYGSERIRWEIEARLLGGQDDAGIGTRTGIAADVIEAYEALFYSVRARLHYIDWVGAVAIGPRAYRGFTK